MAAYRVFMSSSMESAKELVANINAKENLMTICGPHLLRVPVEWIRNDVIVASLVARGLPLSFCISRVTALWFRRLWGAVEYNPLDKLLRTAGCRSDRHTRCTAPDLFRRKLRPHKWHYLGIPARIHRN